MFNGVLGIDSYMILASYIRMCSYDLEVFKVVDGSSSELMVTFIISVPDAHTSQISVVESMVLSNVFYNILTTIRVTYLTYIICLLP